jgi:hypothetical protein
MSDNVELPSLDTIIEAVGKEPAQPKPKLDPEF